MTINFANLTLFKVGNDHSYTCASEVAKDKHDGEPVQVTFSNIQIDAFRTKPTNDVSYSNGRRTEQRRLSCPCDDLF